MKVAKTLVSVYWKWINFVPKLGNIGLCTKYLFCIWIGIGLRHSDGVPSGWESSEGVRHCDVVFMLYRRYICRTYKTCLVVKVYQIKVYRNPERKETIFISFLCSWCYLIKLHSFNVLGCVILIGAVTLILYYKWHSQALLSLHVDLYLFE